MDKIRDVRYTVAKEPDDSHPKARTKREQDAQDDEDDKFKREYGQTEIFRRVHLLAQYRRWKNLVL
jgi:hypothetical protein